MGWTLKMKKKLRMITLKHRQKVLPFIHNAYPYTESSKYARCDENVSKDQKDIGKTLKNKTRATTLLIRQIELPFLPSSTLLL